MSKPCTEPARSSRAAGAAAANGRATRREVAESFIMGKIVREIPIWSKFADTFVAEGSSALASSNNADFADVYILSNPW